MAYFEHEGCTLHYEEYGQGEPLVLLHGLGSSCQDWELQVPVLSGHYRVILMDIRGHGRSDKPADGYQIATFSADLLALLEHLHTGPVHFVGLSMGGMVGFQFAVDHPQWLRSLCIVNSAPEVKRRTRSDWLWWFKRWSLARVLSVETVGKGLAERLFPKPQQADLRQKMAQRWAIFCRRSACCGLGNSRSARPLPTVSTLSTRARLQRLNHHSQSLRVRRLTSGALLTMHRLRNH